MYFLQGEQKKFLATHKQRFESYHKASSAVKKHKKKGRNNKQATDKEIKVIFFSYFFQK